MAKNESWILIRNLGILFGGIFTIGSAISIKNNGLPNYNDRILNGIGLTLLDIGPILLILTLGFKIFEFKDQEEKSSIIQNTIGIRRFGSFTLTIFLFESFVSATIARLLNTIFPGIINSIIFGLLVFIPILICLWWIILRLWENFNFKYSIEWFFGTLKNKISGSKSEKFDFKKNIYEPIEFS